MEPHSFLILFTGMILLLMVESKERKQICLHYLNSFSLEAEISVGKYRLAKV